MAPLTRGNSFPGGNRRQFFAHETTRRVCGGNCAGQSLTWEDPAIQTISALMDAGREDIKIVTGDLDTEVAQDVANGHLIIGMSAQMPYDQGEELAYAVANVLLGKRVSKVIGVEPLLVTAANLEEAWYVMTKEKAPQSIVNSLTETRKKEKMRIEKNSKWKTK